MAPLTKFSELHIFKFKRTHWCHPKFVIFHPNGAPETLGHFEVVIYLVLQSTSAKAILSQKLLHFSEKIDHSNRNILNIPLIKHITYFIFQNSQKEKKKPLCKFRVRFLSRFSSGTLLFQLPLYFLNVDLLLPTTSVSLITYSSIILSQLHCLIGPFFLGRILIATYSPYFFTFF